MASASIMTRSLPLVSPLRGSLRLSPPRRPAPPVVLSVPGLPLQGGRHNMTDASGEAERRKAALRPRRFTRGRGPIYSLACLPALGDFSHSLGRMRALLDDERLRHSSCHSAGVGRPVGRAGPELSSFCTRLARSANIWIIGSANCRGRVSTMQSVPRQLPFSAKSGKPA